MKTTLTISSSATFKRNDDLIINGKEYQVRKIIDGNTITIKSIGIFRRIWRWLLKFFSKLDNSFPSGPP